MKKTLTVLCLMIAVVGAGQDDSITFRPLGRFHIGIDTLPQPKYDTIPIIYLYADTAKRAMEDGKFVGGYTRWDFGYEVRRVQAWFYPLHITYLDRQKNPIRKSMIIWQIKTIEK